MYQCTDGLQVSTHWNYRYAVTEISPGLLALGQFAHECALKVAPDEIGRSLYVIARFVGATGHIDPLIHKRTPSAATFRAIFLHGQPRAEALGYNL